MHAFRSLFPSVRVPIARWLAVLWGVAAVVLVVSLYMTISGNVHEKNPNDTTVPTLTQMVDGFRNLAHENRRGEVEFILDLQATLARFGWGMLYSIVASVVLGLAMGCLAWMEAFWRPLLSSAAKFIPMAMISVFFVLIGLHEALYVSIIAFGVVPTFSLAVCNAAKSVPIQLIHKGYSLGGSTPEVILMVVFRMVLPAIIQSIMLSTGPALNYLVGSEAMLADVGFGYRIRILSRVFEMNTVFAYLIILALLGFFIDLVLKGCSRMACRWAE